LTEEHASHVDLTQLSRAFGIHPVHLTRSFRRHLRCTPGEYLRSFRLDRAARLLTSGRKPIAEVAVHTGFADQSHLNRHFTRAYGVSPARYRKMTCC
jgi:AraC family transcriptional regulator